MRATAIAVILLLCVESTFSQKVAFSQFCLSFLVLHCLSLNNLEKQVQKLLVIEQP